MDYDNYASSEPLQGQSMICFLHKTESDSGERILPCLIIPVSKWVVTPNYKPPFGRGATLLGGLTDRLLTGMILQVGMTTNHGMGILITSSVYWMRLLPQKVTAGTKKNVIPKSKKGKSSEPSTSILLKCHLDILGFLGCIR